jgi:hypothetical protein
VYWFALILGVSADLSASVMDSSSINFHHREMETGQRHRKTKRVPEPAPEGEQAVALIQNNK